MKNETEETIEETKEEKIERFNKENNVKNYCRIKLSATEFMDIPA